LVKKDSSRSIQKKGYIVFYKDYFNKSVEDATKYKIEYLTHLLNNFTVYKFVQFNNDDEDILKLNSIDKKSLWFSYYRCLNDPSEYEIKYNISKIEKYSTMNKEELEYLYGSMKELYDVCSFSYEYSNYMWDIYSNGGNGLCIEFYSEDLDMLYPVDYINKNKISFTNIIINSVNALDRGIVKNIPMAVLPFVTKNPVNGKLDSTKENEIRMLYSFYNDRDFEKGNLYPNVKKNNHYLGIDVPYDKLNLKVAKIIIGDGCFNQIIERITDICKKNYYPYEFKNK